MTTTGKHNQEAEKIKAALCRASGITIRELMSRRRTAPIAEPRQLGYFLVRTITQMKWVSCARVFRRTQGSAIEGARAALDRIRLYPRDRALYDSTVAILQNNRRKTKRVK